MALLRLTDDHLDFALKHVEKYGDTDIFPVPFEFDVIRSCWAGSIKPHIMKYDVTTIHTRPARRILSPKAERGFRPAIQLDPIDSLIYIALVYALGADIEASRLPSSERIGLSHRFAPSPDGDFWQYDSNWNSFIERTHELAKLSSVRWVLKADIADFFPHIYHHRLETRLTRATEEVHFVKAIMNLLNGWSGRVSYGLPIGPAPSRLLAELLLDPVDRMLKDSGYRHCRWIDDFNVFCETEADAQRAEVQIVRTLYENYGLTLQYSKTKIVPIYEFTREKSEMEIAIVTDSAGNPITDDAMVEEVRELLNETGTVSLAPLDMRRLPIALQNLINNYDLNSVLLFLLEVYEELDIGVLKVILEELTRRKDFRSAELILEHLDDLGLIMSSVAHFFMAGKDDISEPLRTKIGDACLSRAAKLLKAGQDYGALWLLWIVACTKSFDNESSLAKQFDETASDVGRRELILGLGNAGNGEWFLTRRNDLLGMSPWTKRAFLHASASMLPDERKHWLKSIMPQLDELERAIIA